ncbi:SNF2 family N-terminal domain-containing protein [Aspergillus pseudonomiae]|uniref:SNF2 family N-terminal domain-containing protein n=1 Tax=Aspergillus pseudonomiae TaxID=1506151 RepID=A0A5N7DLG9_9EURO|nr:SNF2 family N-terminal domain-containing protein [Aspergillus pseudonomiae]KAB8258444.1 SNF2 family N-terminal domain-containing protein [Aspergillus pseudonomiae]KAE8407280.1 SNF2 family N-terminal domain-containing protein [Aspergillus pseudonomiae]
MDDSVPDTPVSDKKVIHNTPPGREDEGYETVATVPLPNFQQPATQSLTPATQRLTQPTQIIEPPYSAKGNSVIQVAASSPPGPTSSPSRPALPGGRLASAMAPSGTLFRPPAVGPAKRAPVIDLEDDGPTYRGGSSDDDDIQMTSSTDIKPSLFAKSSRNPEKVLDSPGGANNSSFDRFKEITASAVYNPSSAKRPAAQMDPVPKGTAVKKLRQDGPSRAQPVQLDISSLQDIEDYQLRAKVEKMQRVIPQKSVKACMQALLTKRGNYDDALDYLASMVEGEADGTADLSDDELALNKRASPVAPAKQQIKARGTIQNKWAAMRLENRSTPKAPAQPSDEESKPRRRLIRGPKARVSSPSPDRSESPPKKKPGRLIQGRKQPSPEPSEPEASMSDDSDSGVEAIPEGESALETRVLRFFNTCNVLDLADIAAITEDVANVIISNRPFATLDEVRVVTAPTTEQTAKPKGSRGRKTPKPIGDKIVDKCMDMWVGYEAVDSLVAKCEALGKPIASEMKKWGVDIFGKRDGELELTSINPGASHDSGIGTPASQRSEDDSDGPATGSRKSRFISQPGIMREDLKMKDYQIVGINWLSLLFEKELSCILADDMGLGKTCQVIAFLAHLFEKGIKGPHLIVVPSSTIENWLREFQKFCPALSVMPYYAGQAERAVIRETIEDNRDSINVIVTTYTIAKAKVDAHFLRNMDFTVCVYDEGHMLKSSTSVLYEKLIRIRARFRLLLTGTPLQNNLQELASLLGFILPKVFQERKEELQNIFANKAKTVDESHSALLSAQRIERAKSMLKPFVLRRKKHQVIDLPPKISKVEYCELNESQREIYEHEQEEVRKLLADRAAGKKTGNKSANILMKLRQAAIHPLLYRRHYNNTTLSRMAKACLKEEQWSLSNPDIIYEELLAYNDFECHTMCVNYPKSLGKFALKNNEWMDSGKIDKLCELLKRFKENGDRTLIFSQFTMVMDILEHVLENQHLGFVRLDGRTNVEDRQSILDAFHERTEIPVFLLSTKAGGAGINLACANKVVIFDSSFNPQEDVQAENRAHRVGQTREVEVIRLVTKDTIEEQIYALGQTKLALDQAVAGEDAAELKKSEEAGMKAVEDMLIAGSNGEKQNSS